MSAVIIHKYVEQNPKRLKKDSCADCANCAMAEKTRILGGGEGYLCKARLYDIKTLACFTPKPCATTMTFGEAIEAAKMGKKIAREGWNGKGMFLYYVPAAAYPPSTDVAKKAFGGENVPYGAYVAMKTAQGNVVPWLASQTDMLADDWIIKE